MNFPSYSDSDRQILLTIFGEEYGRRTKPTIYVSKFLPEKHPVVRVEGQSTMMDYIQPSGTPEESTVVFNHLVDRSSIEAVVVCKTQAEAKEITSFAKDVPRHMKYAITLDFNKFQPPNPQGFGYRTTYIDPVRDKVIGSDLSQTLDSNQKEVESETQHLQAIASKIAELEKEENTLKGKIVQVKRKTSRIKQELQKLETELTEISAEPEMSDDLQELKDTYREKREKLESTQKREEELQAKISQMSEELEKKKELHNEKKKKLSEELETSSGSIETQLSELERLISDKTKLIRNQELAKLGQQRILEGLQQDSEKVKSRLATERKSAESQTNGCVLNPSHTVPQIVAKIKRIQEQKKANPTEVARRRRDEIGEVYREKQMLLADQKSKLESLKKIAAEMEKANWVRRDAFHLIRKFVCNRVRRQFNYNSATFSHEVRFYPVFATFYLGSHSVWSPGLRQHRSPQA